MLEKSQTVGGHEARGGGDHPYRLMRIANYALDLHAVGELEKADELRRVSLEGLRDLLGELHTEMQTAEQGLRTEGDIEPPPT
jgi:hypothetical protein